MFRVVSPVLRVYDDGAVEAILEHVFEAVDLEVIFSLLAELHVEPHRSRARARAQRIAGCCKQSYQWQSSHHALKADRFALAAFAHF